jgi:hypothetical protein
LKVKKFRIRPRLGLVARALKAQLGVKHLSPEIEESIPTESQAFTEYLNPVAFYQTWTNDDVPAAFREFLKPVGLDKALAVSALIATIGPAPEEYLSEVLLAGETSRAQLITALADDSADLAFNFLCRLLVDDAKGDDCEVTPPLMVTDPTALAETLKVISADQESVHLDSASHLSPRFTRVALTAWLPVNKRKKLAQAPKFKS